ncbi:MAG: hypothetical protein HQM09_23840 [Candidatus Riflebacteria bacterium]|nr:hypothetical protein [Candidatus Riflebacteria bacterium]
MFPNRFAIILLLAITTGFTNPNVLAGQDKPDNKKPKKTYDKECYALAFADKRVFGRLKQDFTEDLCYGAPTPNGPIDCFLAGVLDEKTMYYITKPHLVSLCWHAKDDSPVACFNLLRNNTDIVALLDEPMQQIVPTCQGAQNTFPAECVRLGYISEKAADENSSAPDFSEARAKFGQHMKDAIKEILKECGPHKKKQ